MNYKLRSKRIYSRLIKKGKFKEASRLLRSLINGTKFIDIGLNDTDWMLANEFGDNLSWKKSIRIQ